MYNNRLAVSTDANPPNIPKVTVVCAVDFGTTYTSYAYSFTGTPTEIFCHVWKSISRLSYETTTTLLLDKEQNVLAFGYEAERMYSKLVEDGEADEVFYFRGFKTILYDKIRTEEPSTETNISDINGKYLPAKDIFSHAIRYIRGCLHNELKCTGVQIQDENIEWVFVVPVIRDEFAKQFMRKAAEKAGMDTNKLKIALEPETVILFCQELPMDKFEQISNCINVFSLGTRCLVVNARGGTVDMTVHEIKSDGKLHTLCAACVGHWGGVKVIKTFKQMLTDIVGENFLNTYCKKFTEDYCELLKDFQVKIREKKEESSNSEMISLKISPTFSETYETEHGEDISRRTRETKYAESLKWSGDKIRIKRDLFESFFRPSCEGIVENVRNILTDPKVKGTDIIIMVGSFSESDIVQRAVRNAFPECRLFIPQDAGQAVLKGAVLFGHDTIKNC